jgi:toxin CcdB
MARLSIYEAPQSDSLLLDVQSDLFDSFTTRVVVPLLPASTTPPSISRLHPIFTIDGIKYVLATHLISAVPREILNRQRGSLAGQRDRITAALDMLYQGF